MILCLLTGELPWRGGYDYEAECIVRLFYPGAKLRITHQAEEEQREDYITACVFPEGERLRVDVRLLLGGGELTGSDLVLPAEAADGDLSWEARRRLCLLLYRLLSRHTGLRPPWGVLIGVRPLRLCRKLLRSLGSVDAVGDALVRDYLVLPEKAGLALSVLKAQQPILEATTADSYSLYVGIPFCPTRCLYCSFVSHAIDRAGKLLPDYLELLCRELEEIGGIAARLGLRLRTVYIGGGTPTVLEPPQLDRLLGQIEKSFPLSGISEYTVEAGRPDSISREKLGVLREYGISRISVNPQALDDGVLAAIGRAHTARDTLEAVELVRAMGFDNLNMDLIAGLPEQSYRSFADTLEQVIALEPENVTVHTLTVKRSSNLRAELGSDAYRDAAFGVADALEHAWRRLGEAGYTPYYLYRQQGARQNLENTGFAKPGREGHYNIYSMEDAQTILAAGAGAVTKLCSPSGRLQRVFNYKYPYEYNSGFAEILKRKRDIVDFYQVTAP